MAEEPAVVEKVDLMLPRNYQLELYHEIMERKSSILFLPAGSGKTYIAILVIKAMAAALKK